MVLEVPEKTMDYLENGMNRIFARAEDIEEREELRVHEWDILRPLIADHKLEKAIWMPSARIPYEELNDLYKGEKALGSMKTVLQSFLDACTTAHKLVLDRSHLASRTLRNHANRLPDEVLISIVEYAALSSPNVSATGLVLSHVNKRFRAISVGLPKIWTTLRMSSKLELTSLCLDRAKYHGFNVEIDLVQGSSKLGQFVNKVLDFYGKWRTLIVRGKNWKDAKERESFWWFGERSKGVNFNDLSALCLAHDAGYLLQVLTDIGYSAPYYASWKLPNLREAKFVNVIPANFAMAPSLVRLHIWIQADLFRKTAHIGFGAVFQRLARALLSCIYRFCTVQELELLIEHFVLDETEHPLTPFDWITQPNTRVFTLRMRNSEDLEHGDRVLGSLKRVVAHMHMPYLRKLTLDLAVFEQLNIGHVASDFFLLATGQSFPRLECLEIKFEIIPVTQGPVVNNALAAGEEGLWDSARLVFPLNRFPKLKCLRLNTNPMVNIVNDGVMFEAPPSILEILLFNCGEATLDWVWNTRLALEEMFCADTFQRLLVQKCPQLSLEDLRGVIPAHKLFYHA